MAGAFDLDDLEDLEEAAAPSRTPKSRLVSSAVYFDQVARHNISWFSQEHQAWVRCAPDSNGKWTGWSATGQPAELDGGWTPWEKLLDDAQPPFYAWFVGGLTNAAFNEVDLHVLEGHGDQLAYIEEADPMVKGDLPSQTSRLELLCRSAAAARVLRERYGLQTGDRVLFFLPPGIDQITWVEACKRLGVIYCCCNPALPPEQIADRVYMMRAKLVITAEHPDWSYVVHKALNDYVSVEEAIERAARLPGFDRHKLQARWANQHTVSVREPPFEGCDEGLKKMQEVLLGAKVLILGAVQVPFSFVHQKIKKPWVKADTETITQLPLPDLNVEGPAAVAQIWAEYGAPVPVDANFPLFIIFTSGTTGKPKGVVHVHSYIAGLIETMKVVFEADPAKDRMLTVGALGWITGQSYQISAVLGSRITAVLMRGNPVRPTRSRFAQVINKHNVTIFKAGSAFLREVMSSGDAMKEVKDENPTNTLRVATFCAEPVSGAVQAFAMDAVCRNYINSYWATEHGGIAWSRRYNYAKQPLKADAHSWPMPWLDASTYVFDETSRPSTLGGTWLARYAEVGERAEVVCTAPYPYMFRYVWGDVDNFGKPGWIGDRSTMLSKYWRHTQLTDGSEQWAYVQGDFAVRYEDGSYTFHGRSDEVLNVNGILFGTEHIEGAILRDKQHNKHSVVGHCVVVGFPDQVAGEVPLAFIVPAGDRTPSNEDFLRLFNLVNETVGSVHVKFIVVSSLPQTFSGKFMRRLLKSISRGEPLGDMSSISNPECIPKLQEEFARWDREQSS